MPKIKSGEVISWKEFFSRWKKGIEGLTLEQKIRGQSLGTLVQIIGLVCGLTVTFIAFKSYWWVSIILMGGLFVTVIQYIGFWQQLKIFEKLKEGLGIDNVMPEVQAM